VDVTPLKRPSAGLVSVVILNYRGADDTIACVRAFDDISWPADLLELIVVDNASGDGSAARIREALPTVTVIESPTNTGFAGGCNFGAAQARGEYIGFINNDARPDLGWIAAAVDVLDAEPRIASVASKVLDWDGERIDYVDGSLTWYGMGYKRECELVDTGEHDIGRDVLFATGAAMFVRASVYRDVGGFDERFFMFYEDVDLGWRLNLLGHRVRYVPASVAFHRHHASMKTVGPWREHFLLERNALFAMYKNYGDEFLAKALPGALMLAVRRGVSRGGDDPLALDLRSGVQSGEAETVEVSRETLAPAYAIDELVAHLPALHEERTRLQAARRRSDKDLLPLFRQMMEPAYSDPRYLDGHRAIVEALGLEQQFSPRRRIVVTTGDTLAAKMAGPAIRAVAMAEVLSAEHDVELVTLGRCTLTHPAFRCRSVTGTELKALERRSDVMIFQGLVMSSFPWIRHSDKVLVADIYNPFHLEQLEQGKDGGEAARAKIVRECVEALNGQLSRGDFFLCASEKQRDFWLGQLGSLGRINPATYDDDETLESLIAVVPFGVSDRPPKHTRDALKGVVPGIGRDDKVVLWGGGIYNWFDPLTLIQAIDRLRARRPDVRLFFLGLKHPNPDVPEMRMAVAARSLSDSLGLTGKHVFFNEEWVAYEDRQNYLLEADVGVSTHLTHVETAFSFRTRILDYLWAALPVVATAGDTFADLIEGQGLGLTVPAGDVAALEDALYRMLDDDAFHGGCRANLARVSGDYSWTKVLQPLLEFCRSPRRAPDLAGGPGRPAAAPGRPGPGLADDVARLRAHLRDGDFAGVARKVYGRVRRLVQ
jgi:GT2 family glycosyltransferase/glycosyltransferase involved in cell wall biosynthesis